VQQRQETFQVLWRFVVLKGEINRQSATLESAIGLVALIGDKTYPT
jgi:hypothetical protein